MEIPTIFFMLFLLFLHNYCFCSDHNGNATALYFCVIPAIAPYIGYFKIRVENYKTYGKTKLFKYLS